MTRLTNGRRAGERLRDGPAGVGVEVVVVRKKGESGSECEERRASNRGRPIVNNVQKRLRPRLGVVKLRIWLAAEFGKIPYPEHEPSCSTARHALHPQHPRICARFGAAIEKNWESTYMCSLARSFGAVVVSIQSRASNRSLACGHP